MDNEILKSILNSFKEIGCSLARIVLGATLYICVAYLFARIATLVAGMGMGFYSTYELKNFFLMTFGLGCVTLFFLKGVPPKIEDKRDE